MNKNNYLKLVILEKEKLLSLMESKKKNKGFNLFYNTKLNALAGLKNNQTFNKYLLNVFLVKKRDMLIKHFYGVQSKAFQKLQSTKRKTYIFLRNIHSYKAVRLSKALPIRGQRTHTNAKTARKFNKAF